MCMLGLLSGASPGLHHAAQTSHMACSSSCICRLLSMLSLLVGLLEASKGAS